MRRPTSKSPEATRSAPPSNASASRTTLPVMIIAVTLRAMSPRSTRKEVTIARFEEILDMTSLYRKYCEVAELLREPGRVASIIAGMNVKEILAQLKSLGDDARRKHNAK